MAHVIIICGVTHLEGLVVSLQLPAQSLQLAAGEDGPAVLALELVLLFHHLQQFLLQHLQLLLVTTVLFQLDGVIQAGRHIKDTLSWQWCWNLA